MSSSSPIWHIRISSLKGVQIHVHASFLLIFLWLALDESAHSHTLPVQLLLIAGYLCALALHEAAHLIYAVTSGFRMRSITLYPSGSFADQSSENNVRRELLYGLSGPLVSLLAALIVFASRRPPLAIDTDSPFLSGFFISSVLIGALNLLPVFPLDGWRIMKSGLVLLKVRKISLISSRVNNALTIGIAAAAIVFANPWLIAVALLMAFSSVREHVRIKTAEAAAGVKVQNVMIGRDNLTALTHGMTLSTAKDIILKSFQLYFPVLHNQQLIGLVDRETFIRALAAGQGEDYISSLMNRDFQSFLPGDRLTEVMETFFNSVSDCSVVLNERNEFEGLLVKEKVIEFLLLDRMFEESRNRDISSDEFFP